MKKKIIYDKEISNQKKVFRTPIAPATKWHKDKSKYNRRIKHRGES